MSSVAADEIGGDVDLMAEILLRLPVKPLIRFKLVSKRWLSLISSPHFSRRHAGRNKSAVSGIFFRRTPGLVDDDAQFEFISLDGKLPPPAPPFTSLKFADDPQGIKILQSCNGLMCCCSSRKVGNKRSYYIYNPTTKQYITLPRPYDDDVTTKIFGVCLAFDPLKSPYYKVVCVRSTVSSMYYYQIEIYSSENGLWRLSGDPFTAPYNMVFDNGVFSNGAICWISPSGALLHFDVEKECLEEMPSHPFMEHWGKRRFRFWGECSGHLHLLDIAGSRTTRFEVFEMDRTNSNWVLKYVVDLDAIVSAYPEMVRSYLDAGEFYYAFFILSIVREENDEDSFLLLHIPGKIISYKFMDKTFKILRDLTPAGRRTNKEGTLQFGCLDAYHYIETLALACGC